MLRRGHALLDADEAAVFRRFAVLDGSVGLPLIKQVVAGDDVAPVRVVRILRELTARGLLAVDSSGARWLYRQDDDVRRFAREQLPRPARRSRRFAAARPTRSVLSCPTTRGRPRRVRAAGHRRSLGSVRSLFSAALTGRRRRGTPASRLPSGCTATGLPPTWPRAASGCPGCSPATRPEWAPLRHLWRGYLSYWAGDTDARDQRAADGGRIASRRRRLLRARALIFLAGLADDLDRGADAVEYVRQAIEAAAPYGVDLQVSAAMGMACVLAERADPAAVGFAAKRSSCAARVVRPSSSPRRCRPRRWCCWQVGDLDAARRYVDEARPMHLGGRRIARVVLLSAAAGVALAEGDVAAALDHGTHADRRRPS